MARFKAYGQGVKVFSDLVKQLLAECNGYKCKNPTNEKFTLAFWKFEDAAIFCCTL